MDTKDETVNGKEHTNEPLEEISVKENIKEPTAEERRPEYETVKDIIRVNENMPNYDFIFSLCLVGNASVGKTSLLTRFCEGTYRDRYSNTIGVDFKIISLKYKNINIKLHLWDTAGQERFRSISVNYFRNVHGFFFVYDINNKESFEGLNQWIVLAKSYNKNAMVNFLVANKCDLQREVSLKDGMDYAKDNGLIYFETSAKNNDNVEASFNYMAHKLLEFYSNNKSIYEMFSPANTKIKNDIDSNGKKLSSSNEKKCC